MASAVYRVRLLTAGPEQYLSSWRRYRSGALKGQWDLTYANTATNTPRLWATPAAAQRAADQFTTAERAFTVEAAYILAEGEMPTYLRDQPTLLEVAS